MERTEGVKRSGGVIGIVPDAGEIFEGAFSGANVRITRGYIDRNEEFVDAVTVQVEGEPRNRWSALGRCAVAYGNEISTIIFPMEPDSTDTMVFPVVGTESQPRL